MGGDVRYPYPKDVWSPSGGWWPNPRKWRRNTALCIAFATIMAVPIAIYGESITEYQNPVRKIPWRPNLLTRDEVYALYDAAKEAEKNAEKK
mmetsp:Transcript_11825/g.20280  ORF Transcript_11825/g.20280 Transcript_11825/m.20280 type:complete len:92 (-) Transcript_11825:255-530(-)|eukprot:CAMPEP_0184693670 /NCGR_PEP_ID=MMETSP0313-20130426/1841_1 /TAXON_ID=2792 /ORGANISM="Porphyridium aerugineum, Strain SAG 1380-2" /LENGTH=91 /DNA_ID=CAMNT_0027151809 /DNA_START=79 /DNA_END=354 /DNA_ORIENTATION=-